MMNRPGAMAVDYSYFHCDSCMWVRVKGCNYFHFDSYMEVMAVDYNYLHLDSCMEVRVKDYNLLNIQYHTYHVPNFLCISYLVIHHCNDELKIKTNLGHRAFLK